MFNSFPFLQISKPHQYFGQVYRMPGHILFISYANFIGLNLYFIPRTNKVKHSIYWVKNGQPKTTFINRKFGTVTLQSTK